MNKGVMEKEVVEKEIEDKEVLFKRLLSKKLEIALSILAVATALLYMYTAYFGQLTPLKQRGIILLTALVFGFIYTPLSKKSPMGWSFAVDCLLALLSIATFGYLLYREPEYSQGIIYLGTNLDLIMGVILLLLILESARRLIGWVMVIVPLLFIFYTLFGNYAPGPLRHLGFDLRFTLTALCWMEGNGIFSTPLYVASTVIIIFMLFSSFLKLSGGQVFLTELPQALFGGMTAGPAKIAVVASSLFGTISGSVVANIMVDGWYTIPLMKRVGYKPEMAGAIETLASTGGQIMPPVMGAAAFIMADLLGISYWTVCVAAFLPAILYYISLFVIVDLEARKMGIKIIPRSELPSIRKTLAKGWFMLIPLILLVYLLEEMWSPMKAGLYALVAVWVVSFFRRETRMGVRKIFAALVAGVESMTIVTVVCAAAGILIGTATLTGVGERLSAVLVSISGGHLIVLLILTMVVSIFLGMGMTTSACYVFLAVLVGPALVKMGVLPLAAHLFIFYYGCLSAITPPVAIGSYAAAAIAKVDPMKLGWVAWRLGLIAFIVPYFFVYSPELILVGKTANILLTAGTAIIGTIAFAGMLTNYLYGKTNITERILLGAGGLCLIKPGLITDIIGFGLLAIVIASQLIRRKRVRGISKIEG